MYCVKCLFKATNTSGEPSDEYVFQDPADQPVASLDHALDTMAITRPFPSVHIIGAYRGSHGIWPQGIWSQGIWSQGIWSQDIWPQGIWSHRGYRGTVSVGYQPTRGVQRVQRVQYVRQCAINACPRARRAQMPQTHMRAIYR